MTNQAASSGVEVHAPGPKWNRAREAGVLLPVSALPGTGSIGDLDGAPDFLNWLASAGVGVWQILPLNPVDEYGSPYCSWSSLTCAPLLAGLQPLMDAGLLDVAAGEGADTSGRIDYKRAAEGKLPKVLEAARRLRERPDHPWFVGLQQFERDEGWARDAAVFWAIGLEHGGEPWWRWPTELRDAEQAAVASARERHADQIATWVAASYLFARQWEEVRRLASDKGIAILGDMPIYVAHNSVDVWLHQHLFELEEGGDVGVVAGVPPDTYSEEGQLWGNPLYNWEAMRTDGYQWWIARMGRAQALYDGLRVDHFIGFDRFWSVPADEPDARGGEWRPGPGGDVLDAIFGAIGDFPLIAEDLGAMREETIALREAYGLPGMRVMVFAWDTHPDNPHPLRHHQPSSIVYSSTHDSDTARGFWEARRGGEDAPLPAAPEGRSAARIVVGMALRSRARCAIIPAQDILELGGEARMNRPGTTVGNWVWRLGVGELGAAEAADFRARVECASRLNQGGDRPAPASPCVEPFQPTARQGLLGPRVAYFCMEYGISHELPIYSGGLGVLAGDIVKAARDQERDFIAIGVLWGEGYFVQRVDEQGAQRAEYISTPRERLRPTGVEVEVLIAGERVPVTAWRVEDMGSVELLLIEPVREEHRVMTRRLYAGSGDDRVKQEILLGVGGVRVLRALGLPVDVYHFNEGHALFAGLEMVREKMATGAPFESAVNATRNEVVFTTHTPVPAGNETHPVDRLMRCGADLGVLSREQLEGLGGDPFEMTPAALRLSRGANAVAELHGETARAMWAHVEGAAPIRAITNGVHMPTWQDARLSRLARAGEPAALWARHQELKESLLSEIELRSGSSLNASALLIGFARRAATYKRATLLLRDEAWLRELFAAGRLQFVFAGKAHPQDEGGKALIQELVRASRRFPSGLVFLENYDMRLGALLTRGCDVWLNNPVRPKEASGTSGMKAAANGVLNLSILDGWWDEGCDHGVNGWGVGAPGEGIDADGHDYHALRDLIDGTVLPTYEGDPVRWRGMMRASIQSAEERFSADRCVARYFEELYPASL